MTLSELLERSGLNQVELARKLGISQPSVNRWRHIGIPIKRVQKLSKVTGIPASAIHPAFAVER